MGTVPTGTLERELRKLYLRWLVGVPSHQQDMTAYVQSFQASSTKLITELGGQAASLGALADFPTPKLLELSPVADVVYNQMTQSAIQASIAAGLQATDAARQIMAAGLDKGFRRLNMVARTEVVRAYWKNSWDSVEGLGLVMVWSAEKGPRTCDYCLSRDGLVVEDRTIQDHPNGRCTLVAKVPKLLDYRGTLQPGPQAAKPRIAHNVKPNPQVAPQAETVQKTAIGPAGPAKATPTQAYSTMTPQDKVNAAAKMYGTGSPQHAQAIAKFTPNSPAAVKAVDAVVPEEKYVAALADELRKGSFTVEQLRVQANAASALGRANAEAAIARHEAYRAARPISDGTRGLKGLHPDLEAALTPSPSAGFSWSKTTQRIDAVENAPDGKPLADMMRSFQDGGSSIARLRNDTARYIQAGADAGLNATRVANIEQMLRAINTIPAPPKLWRGMRIQGKASDVLAKYQAGTDMDISLGSFTSQRSVADNFALRPQGGKKVDLNKTVPVRFEWADSEGMTGLPLQNISTGKAFYDEKEWVASGRFKVVDAKISNAGAAQTVVVRITRTEKW